MMEPPDGLVGLAFAISLLASKHIDLLKVIFGRLGVVFSQEDTNLEAANLAFANCAFLLPHLTLSLY